jgi:toxin ParE1/3/4
MARRVEQSRAARQDTLACYLFLGQENPAAAERFLEALEAALESLLDMPGMGASFKSEEPRLLGLRRWAVPGFRNYLLFYRETPEGIEVFRVLHGARDLDRILLEGLELEDETEPGEDALL